MHVRLDDPSLARPLLLAVILAAAATLALLLLPRAAGPTLGAALLGAVIVLAGAVWVWRERLLRRRIERLEAQLLDARRRFEEEAARLRGAERAARIEADLASRARDEFVATVSHELRTPLNAVLGWARLLRLGKLDPLTTRRAVETIERSAAAQAQTVDDVLDVSRILRGELRLEMRPVDLIPVVEAAVDAVRAAAAARRIVLAMSLSPRAGQVAGDQGRLQQVIWNLLSNAVKFTPAGGRVEVRLDRDREGGDVTIAVKDTGVGIDPAFTPHLFERFRQADSSTTRAHGGLGLGLALVRHLVEAHGGAVRAESEGRGRGATFMVRLPSALHRRARPAQPAPPPPPRAAPLPATPGPWPLAGLARLRVLVVDDDPDSREVVREVLEQAGAVVSVAGSTPEALRSIAERPPDVLLSDLGMPGEDGYQLMRRVRALDPVAGGSVPAAALTAYTQAENRRAAQEAGFQGYLAKPIDPAELTAAVARLAGRLH